jgi:peptidoglycan/LPS O-acetylase OafA/YrhL
MIDRNNNFNLIRLICMTGVILGHSYGFTYGVTKIHGPSIFGDGTNLWCVGIFFGLSGFLLADANFSGYWTRRCKRIFPQFILFMFVAWLIGAILTEFDFYSYMLQSGSYFLFALLYWGDSKIPGGVNVNLGHLWIIPVLFSMYFLLYLYHRVQLRKTYILYSVLIATITAIVLHPLPQLTPLPQFTLPQLPQSILTYPLKRTVMFWRFWEEYAFFFLGVALSGNRYVNAFSKVNLGPLNVFRVLPDLSYEIYLYAYLIQELLHKSSYAFGLWQFFGLTMLISFFVAYFVKILSRDISHKTVMILRQGSCPKDEKPGMS